MVCGVVAVGGDLSCVVLHRDDSPQCITGIGEFLDNGVRGVAVRDRCNTTGGIVGVLGGAAIAAGFGDELPLDVIVILHEQCVGGITHQGKVTERIVAVMDCIPVAV